MIFGIIFVLLGGFITGTTLGVCVKLNEYPVKKNEKNIYVMNKDTYKDIINEQL